MAYMSSDEIINNLRTLPMDELKKFIYKLPSIKNKAAMAEAMEIIYSRWDDPWGYGEGDYLDMHLQASGFLSPILEANPGRIIDIGSAQGSLWRVMDTDNLDVTLCDISETAINRSRESLSDKPNIDFMIDDLLTLDYSEFDILFQLNVLYIVPAGSRVGFFGNVSRSKPKIIITGTNSDTDWMWEWPDTHVNKILEKNEETGRYVEIGFFNIVDSAYQHELYKNDDTVRPYCLKAWKWIDEQ